MDLEPDNPDPAPPARGGGGMVTLVAISDTMSRRTVTFPDGSTQVSIVEEFGDWGAGPPARLGPGAMGPDAAARTLAETAAGQLLYCHETRAWFAWDGALWRRDRDGRVFRMIRQALRDAGLDDPGPRRVADVESVARSEPTLTAATSPGWDHDPLRLGTPGGTIDLTTGTLRPADPADRITRATAVTPADTSDCPIWRRFLDETTGGDAALTQFLQRFLGYALTGETCEHTLLFGLGDGGNGKSVFLNTVRGILGDYAIVAASDLFTQGTERRVGKAHSSEIAMLAGARLVTASEMEEGRSWADGRLKLLTGGDPVTARHLRRDYTTFTPRFKPIMMGNHLPLMRTVDTAMRRRLAIVPFTTKPAKPDRTLEARLKAEWPQILRWMIEGCLAWRRDGLGRPTVVDEATGDYLGAQDIVWQFLTDACTTGPTETDTAAALYAAWCAFARAAGEPLRSQRRFAAELERFGMTRERTRCARGYRGVRLLTAEERG